MYLIEYLILQTLTIWWFIYIVKNYPKKGRPYSYKVLVGNIGATILMTGALIWTVLEKKSFLYEFYKSIIN